MRMDWLACVALAAAPAAVSAQEIVKVPQNHSRAVARPDDLYALSPGEWHMAKHLWEGQAPCTPEQCEAGLTSGDAVMSVEHSGEFVRIIGAFRGCDAVGSSEVEVGKTPGKPTFGRIRDQMNRVIKGVAKTCKLTVPDLPKLDSSQLFPAKLRP